MANEAYRAVFLRVHPTGKMVLSLTTEADGHEGEYARQVAHQLGVPALDVKVVPADSDRFGNGHGYNSGAVDGRPGGDRVGDRQDPGQGPAARRHRAADRARRAALDAGAFVWPTAMGATTSRGRSPTWRCTRTAPAPCRRGRGGPRRPDGVPGLVGLADGDLSIRRPAPAGSRRSAPRRRR